MKKNKNELSESIFGYRYVAKDRKVSNNTRVTGNNNNDAIIGVSGSGKTSGYVIPNLLVAEHSMVVADTKCQLSRHFRKSLENRGFEVKVLDFFHPEASDCYNPLDYVTRYPDGTYREQDLKTIAEIMIPNSLDEDEIFWPSRARIVLISLLAYVLETLPEEEQHMGSVVKLYRQMLKETSSDQNVSTVSFFEQLAVMDPDSFAVAMYHMYYADMPAEKMWASINAFVSMALDVFNYHEFRRMLCSKEGIDLAAPGERRTVIFVNTSDTDRSMDRVVNLFYTQLFQVLCATADRQEDERLKVPVRVIIDDFAANVIIPDFDNLISVIRSREIYVSIILQNYLQLEGKYDRAGANTIMENCDTLIFLGARTVSSAEYFAKMAGKLPETILSMPRDKMWLFRRGDAPELTDKLTPYFASKEFSQEADYGEKDLQKGA